jgi:hypothetical protein
MVFGIQLSFSRVGSTLNFNVNDRLYSFFESSNPTDEGYTTLGKTLWVGVAMCAMSLFTGLYLWYLDWFTEKRTPGLLSTPSGDDQKVWQSPRFRKICASFQETHSLFLMLQISLRDVKDFPLSLWLVCIICVLYYSAIFPFIDVSLYVSHSASVILAGLTHCFHALQAFPRGKVELEWRRCKHGQQPRLSHLDWRLAHLRHPCGSAWAECSLGCVFCVDWLLLSCSHK